MEEAFEALGLKEYEAGALHELFALGRTTAPRLAEATGIPKARIYGVLDSLADRGFVNVVPGRPKEYQPKPPDEVLERAKENRRQDYEEYVGRVDEIRTDFVDEYAELYEAASDDITPTEELFHVVDVGEPSERETRRLYHEADDEIRVLTKGFEYLPSVERALGDAVERGIDVSVLLVHPRHISEENVDVQADRVRGLRDEHPDVRLRFSDGPLPWRGTFADRSMEYETGEAVLLVEEKDVPLSMRQAAVTDNPSFVAGLSRYFDLIWKHESTDPDDVTFGVGSSSTF
jgi:sugar-specific transcriptional regulator TrmB